MAATFNCDGCGEVIQDYDASANAISVRAEGAEGALMFYGKFDLCKGCRRYYTRIVNPTSWPRTVKEAARAENS